MAAQTQGRGTASKGKVLPKKHYSFDDDDDLYFDDDIDFDEDILTESEIPTKKKESAAPKTRSVEEYLDEIVDRLDRIESELGSAEGLKESRNMSNGNAQRQNYGQQATYVSQPNYYQPNYAQPSGNYGGSMVEEVRSVYADQMQQMQQAQAPQAHAYPLGNRQQPAEGMYRITEDNQYQRIGGVPSMGLQDASEVVDLGDAEHAVYPENTNFVGTACTLSASDYDDDI